MTAYVADTHALFWYLTASPSLSDTARAAFAEADAGRAIIYVPAIALAELFWFNWKKGSAIDFASTVAQLKRATQFRLVADEPEHVLDLEANTAVPEMHDRMIVGHSRRLGAPLITRDPEIIASGLTTVVW